MFSKHFYKGEQLCGFMFAVLYEEALPKGSILKGKNVLLEEQILFFKSLTICKREA